MVLLFPQSNLIPPQFLTEQINANKFQPGKRPIINKNILNILKLIIKLIVAFISTITGKVERENKLLQQQNSEYKDIIHILKKN